MSSFEENSFKGYGRLSPSGQWEQPRENSRGHKKRTGFRTHAYRQMGHFPNFFGGMSGVLKVVKKTGCGSAPISSRTEIRVIRVYPRPLERYGRLRELC